MSEIYVSLDIRNYDATFEIEPLAALDSYRVTFGPASIDMDINILEDLYEVIGDLVSKRLRDISNES